MGLTTADILKAQEWMDAQPTPEYYEIPLDALCAMVSLASSFAEDGTPIEMVN